MFSGLSPAMENLKLKIENEGISFGNNRNHRRRRYHNFQFSIINFQLKQQGRPLAVRFAICPKDWKEEKPC